MAEGSVIGMAAPRLQRAPVLPRPGEEAKSGIPPASAIAAGRGNGEQVQRMGSTASLARKSKLMVNVPESFQSAIGMSAKRAYMPALPQE
ncbi:hypothetical protein [Roseivivax sediminis]|uniref:hypothetical protein n=1 Tax=Roseivivax sediminis TaxID=936889 RepID=UPI00165EFA6B|nr:hypothetical protein [Roseivivax sediminis]